jgi:hypothetical protein
VIIQDLGLNIMLGSISPPDEDGATLHKARSRLMLGRMWQEEELLHSLT